MSDLDKLMQNLKKNKDEAEAKETPQETEELKEGDEDDFDDQDDDEDDQDEDEEEVVKPAQNNKPSPKKADPQVKAPAQNDDDHNPIEHEVALLQNEGIFRRELLLTLKELVDVQKVNAQVMIDIKKAVTGDKNAK